jgi:ribulose-bisphosphate carboxylase large chain
MKISSAEDRFTVHYRLFGVASLREARDKSRLIALEQTVELPDDLVAPGPIRQHIVGQQISLKKLKDGSFESVLSYPVGTTGSEIPQFLNVMFGNTSIKPKIRVERFDLPKSLLKTFQGPRFGVKGLRALLKEPKRPLLCTALKPMGLPSRELAKLAYQFALGGIDLIKDDHGLADQPYARFEDRVPRCAEAVEKANRETGRRCLYLPNVSVSIPTLWKRLLFAKKEGAGGFLVSPGLVGFDVMHQMAVDKRLGLPILFHPAFLGSFVVDPHHGMSHYALFGQLARLAGADGSIFPSFGGRFSFSWDDCRQIAQGCHDKMGDLKPIFPVPGGGMSLERVREMLDVYGQDVIFLVGGGLFRQGPDLVENGRYFRRLVETSSN